MKITKIICIIAYTLAAGVLPAQNSVAQDSTGLPGDNFSLEGALEMFKKAGSPEEFERLINTENNGVNNLDLNGDGDIDYIRVIDKRDGDNHAFVLQDAVSETESQDVAVVEVERKGNQNVVLQIVGDEDLYGEQLIVEPQSTQASQPAPAAAVTPPVVVNVWGWPSVQYIYGPSYAVWASPWGWGGRPVWWHPWRPWGWHRFYTYCSPYRPYYRVVNYHRVVYAHRMYTPMRSTSVIVRTRTGPAVTHYRYNRAVYHPASSRYVNTTRTTSVHSYGRTRPTNYQGTNGRTRTTTYPGANGRTQAATVHGTNGRTRTTAVHGTNGRTRSTVVHGGTSGRTHTTTPHGSNGRSRSVRAPSHH
ncbi:MAG TPA: hypothetical protein VIU12_04035 [Chryseolinea sp.]